MFDNIGKKIKGLAKALFYVEAVIFIIGGIAITAATEGDLSAVGIPLVLVGPFIAWLSSLTLYGFGELIDKTCDIERNTRSAGDKARSAVQAKTDDERTQKLEKLRAQGLISEEEYSQALSGKK